MNLDDKTVKKIAHLARLQLQDENIESTKKDLNEILTFMEKLNELDTSHIEPLIYMTEQSNIMREDVVNNNLTTAEALSNAPDKEGNFFKVIKVLDK